MSPGVLFNRWRTGLNLLGVPDVNPAAGPSNSRSNRKRNFKNQILDFGLRIADCRFKVFYLF